MQEKQVPSLIWEDTQEKEWQPTPVFLPGELHGQRSLVGGVHGVAKTQTWLSDWTYTHTHMDLANFNFDQFFLDAKE